MRQGAVHSRTRLLLRCCVPAVAAGLALFPASTAGAATPRPDHHSRSVVTERARHHHDSGHDASSVAASTSHRGASHEQDRDHPRPRAAHVPAAQRSPSAQHSPAAHPRGGDSTRPAVVGARESSHRHPAGHGTIARRPAAGIVRSDVAPDLGSVISSVLGAVTSALDGNQHSASSDGNGASPTTASSESGSSGASGDSHASRSPSGSPADSGSHGRSGVHANAHRATATASTAPKAPAASPSAIAPTATARSSAAPAAGATTLAAAGSPGGPLAGSATLATPSGGAASSNGAAAGAGSTSGTTSTPRRVTAHAVARATSHPQPRYGLPQRLYALAVPAEIVGLSPTFGNVGVFIAAGLGLLSLLVVLGGTRRRSGQG